MGFLNHQGDKDRPPIPIGYPETANHGGVQDAADAVAAIHERDRSGLGQHLDVSMQAAVVGCLLWTSSYAAIDRNPTFTGDDRGQKHRPTGAARSPGVRNPVVEPCADGYAVMSFVLGAQGNAAFAAAMRGLKKKVRSTPIACGRDWEPWIDEMKNGDARGRWMGVGPMTQLLDFLKTKTKAGLHARSVTDKLLIAPANDAGDLLEGPAAASSQLLR